MAVMKGTVLRQETFTPSSHVVNIWGDFFVKKKKGGGDCFPPVHNIEYSQKWHLLLCLSWLLLFI